MKIIIEMTDGTARYLSKKHHDYARGEGPRLTKQRGMAANATQEQYESFVSDVHYKKAQGFFPQVQYVR